MCYTEIYRCHGISVYQYTDVVVYRFTTDIKKFTELPVSNFQYRQPKCTCYRK